MLEGLGETGCVERVMTFHSSWLNTHGLPKPFVGFLLMIGYDRISSKPTGDVRLLFFLRSLDDSWKAHGI